MILAAILDFFKKKIFDQRLGNGFGLIYAVIGGIVIGLVFGKMGFVPGVALIAGLVGIPVVFAGLFNPAIGITIILSISYVLLGIKRFMPEVPLGLFTDVMVLVMAAGIFIKNIYNKNWTVFKGPISTIVLVYLAYVFLTFFNPAAGCKQCFLYTMRSMAGYMIMYFIVSYAITNKNQIKTYLKIWIILSFAAALYTYKQQYLGFFDFENRWIHADPKRFWLLFQWGNLRKFSFMSDPVTLGFNMGYTAVICVVLIFSPLSKKKKILLGIMAFAMFQAMLFTGTRAAFVILPLGAVMFIVLVKSKKLYMLSALAMVFFVMLIFAPINNKIVMRFQSAFKPGEDASFQVRLENQKRIRPFIWSHPLGGGLGGTGVWGKRFAPGSFLANFPPDSGYVRVAVELGWVGLTIYLLLWIVVFIEGIKSYFRIRDPVMKYIALSMLCALFTLFIVNYAQQAVNQVPTSLIFWIAAAIINRGSQLEKENSDNIWTENEQILYRN